MAGVITFQNNYITVSANNEVNTIDFNFKGATDLKNNNEATGPHTGGSIKAVVKYNTKGKAPRVFHAQASGSFVLDADVTISKGGLNDSELVGKDAKGNQITWGLDGVGE
ncbi:hypothetical protein QSH57_004194 [Fusarium oxysporum f. sp. vasinfectum]|nr:hypothetical protein QSH57_004194 [Fusarium oxysporum f. sp. vasinfectum]